MVLIAVRIQISHLSAHWRWCLLDVVNLFHRAANYHYVIRVTQYGEVAGWNLTRVDCVTVLTNINS